jgi:hypothetical protein
MIKSWTIRESMKVSSAKIPRKTRAPRKIFARGHELNSRTKRRETSRRIRAAP